MAIFSSARCPAALLTVTLQSCDRLRGVSKRRKEDTKLMPAAQQMAECPSVHALNHLLWSTGAIQDSDCPQIAQSLSNGTRRNKTYFQHCFTALLLHLRATSTVCSAQNSCKVFDPLSDSPNLQPPPQTSMPACTCMVMIRHFALDGSKQLLSLKSHPQ